MKFSSLLQESEMNISELNMHFPTVKGPRKSSSSFESNSTSIVHFSSPVSQVKSSQASITDCIVFKFSILGRLDRRLTKIKSAQKGPHNWVLGTGETRAIPVTTAASNDHDDDEF